MRSVRLLIACTLFLAPLVFSSCKKGKKNKVMSARITLKRSDKLAYGTYVAFENLKYIFPSAEIDINKDAPSSYTSFANDYDYATPEGEDDTAAVAKGKQLYVVISPYFDPETKDFNTIMEFIGRGNHVFISSYYWGTEFQDSMQINIRSGYEDFLLNDSLADDNDSLWAKVVHPVSTDTLSFTYPGVPDLDYFSKFDTVYANLMGWTRRDRVNLIKHTYEGGGSLYIHTEPLAFSNFFLLHKKNNQYYNIIFSNLPKNISEIHWDEYFRYGGKEFSAWQVVMGNPGLKAAFWLVLLIFLLIYLFESKRKQRIIPTVAPMRNASLEFVKTIGRLYHQYHDNRNLGLKMTAHLMDHIRTRYNIPTSVIDEKFISTLAYKSGYNAENLNKLMYYAKMMQETPRVSDHDLMVYHKLTEAFYKHQ
ncbi:MAG TPA: hypothetical protein VD996_10120 [Chitinophagaceae bacterium]|nr:hypothetical protein [Chitinophagaceae bacterium]